MYFFEVLPIHPQPESLESLTSYLTRLGEANNITSIGKLSKLLFANQDPKITRSLMDHPPLSFGQLPITAVCSETILQNTTFYHLGKKFGRSTQPQATSRFLNGCLARDLRYCPHCLNENPYYRLTWRFKYLIGCPVHHYSLLDYCGHCGRTIPLFSSLLKLGVCPACGGDLRDCKADLLQEDEVKADQIWYQDSVFLLSPHPMIEVIGNINEYIGGGLTYWREVKELTREDVSRLTKMSISEIYYMERGKIEVGLTKFENYVKYIKLFNIAFQDFFNTILPQNKLDERYDTLKKYGEKTRIAKYQEDELVQQVNTAMEQLKIEGKSVTQKAIADDIEMSVEELKRYPRVNVILKQVAESRKKEIFFNTRQDELVQQVNTAMEQLKIEGKSVTQKAIADDIGMSVRGLKRYPRVNDILKQVAESREKAAFNNREDELVQQVNTAMEQLKIEGKSVTQKAIADDIGMSVAGLKRYPRVNVILKQVAESREKAAFNTRQNKLVQQVNMAIEQLKIEGKSITQEVIASKIGISAAGLRYYPRVNEILKQVAEETLKVKQKKLSLNVKWANDKQEQISFEVREQKLVLDV